MQFLVMIFREHTPPPLSYTGAGSSLLLISNEKKTSHKGRFQTQPLLSPIIQVPIENSLHTDSQDPQVCCEVYA